MPKDIFPKLSGSQKSSSSTSVFPNLFFAAPLLVLQIFSRTPMVKYKDRGIVTIGGTPVTSSRHPSVPQHPSWEPLFYLLLLKFFQKVIRRLFSSLHQKALQKGEEKKPTGITFEQFRLFFKQYLFSNCELGGPSKKLANFCLLVIPFFGHTFLILKY